MRQLWCSGSAILITRLFVVMREYQRELPCHSTELVHFRKRIGKEGVEKIFQMSVSLHGEVGAGRYDQY